MKKAKTNNRLAAVVRTLSLFILLITCAVIGAEKKTVIITGDKVITRLVGTENNKKIYLTEITGNPKIKYSGSELTAGKIITRGSEAEVCEASGNVRLTDINKKSKITAGKALYYKLNDTVEFTEKPVITTTRNDDGSAVTIRSERLEYNIEEDTGRACGKVTLNNRDTVIIAEKAVFSRKEKTVTFLENPAIRKNEDTFNADEIIYYTDSKILRLNRNARAVIHSGKKDPGTGKITFTESTITGDKIENFDGREKYTVITGNETARAVVISEDAVFSGDRIEVRGKNNEHVTGNNINIDYKKDNIQGSGRFFNSEKNKKRATLRGDAVLILKNEKTGNETSRIYGDYMEFFEDINELHIFGNVRIDSETGIIKGDTAKYNRDSRIMRIAGNAAINKDGSVLYSRKIIFNTRTNQTELIEDIKGRGIK
ncbi:MAG: LPS export ABC transporter periplasmic protein LptC [Spirochaetes bacterium]|nr:LPS export ABC transporter periplasmic protein LptC [Spirochaetota bacterium]